jgi:phosphoribosylformimino-5-aminoimidazole carboxamide ribotide isomerase
VLTQEHKGTKPFAVVPAVDLLGLEAVRLRRGDYDEVTNRHADPFALVETYRDAGADLIHLVDLDGARTGRVRPDVVERAALAATPSRLQASGGIRSVADAELLLAAGAARIVVGTAAFADDDALARFSSAVGDRLVVAVDVRDGHVAVGGWTQATPITVDEAVERCLAAGVTRILCTAIERDGTLHGPDTNLLGRVCGKGDLAVLAAGGVRSVEDLATIAETGCEGAVVGRALLEGQLPLSALVTSS